MNNKNDFKLNKNNDKNINVNFGIADLKKIFNQQIANALQDIKK